jgi:ABC-type multidrug transport system fused ATPase/permease subunit
MGWHDRNNSAEVANRLISHIDRISSVYDFDMSCMYAAASMAVIPFILALAEDWKLTLAVMSVFPVVLTVFYLNLRFVRKGSEVSRTAFARGAQIASEDVGLIRTIWTFCTQMHESSRFVSFCESHGLISLAASSRQPSLRGKRKCRLRIFWVPSSHSCTRATTSSSAVRP